ncbi:hypothetical protein MIND_00644300 [Mycena indigotica]|uniref:DUF6534 domain-containing protein n=1 Tax=Mycena indigotica TaxID=2126181 RepID=A0A8H6W407_9AGAR|nr:uncharacterized protein MIND_00644300 [Mycena indigotica]KAF7304127.1 hypothetical protein MIND_00644300 [Mycena indigotica]
MAAFNPDSTYGALLVGVILSAVLFGISCTQAYMYHARFPTDPRRLKVLVGVVWACEAAHLGLVSHTLYTWLVTDYGHPERLLGRPPVSLTGFIVLTVFVSVIVQGFFSYRIHVLSKSRVMAYLTYLITAVRLGLGLTIFALALQADTLAAFSVQFDWLLLTMWSLTAAGDIVITLSLVYLLWVQRGKVHKETGAFLDRIIKWTIETGVATSTFTTVMLICFHTMPHNFVWMGLFVMEARMFANSLFASLNSRTVLRDLRQNASGSRSHSDHAMSNMTPPYPPPPFNAQGITIAVRTDFEVEQDRDSDRGMETKGTAW